MIALCWGQLEKQLSAQEKPKGRDQPQKPKHISLLSEHQPSNQFLKQTQACDTGDSHAPLAASRVNCGKVGFEPKNDMEAEDHYLASFSVCFDLDIFFFPESMFMITILEECTKYIA